MTQTLSQGTTIASKYANLGYTGRRMLPPPTGMLWLLVGESNMGKSYLLQTCPDAFIINADLSSTVVDSDEQVKARIWPGLDSEGQPIEMDEQGRDKQISLSFDRMLEVKKALIAWPKEDPDRPRMVVVDSITRLIPYVKDDVAKFAQSRYHIASGDNKDWKELHGPAAWDAVYDAIVQFALDLRNAGYGVCMTLHLTRYNIQVQDNLWKEEVDVTVTRNFWSRLFPMFEMIACLETKTVTEKEERTATDPRTKKTFTRSVDVTKQARVISADWANNVDLRGIVKRRIRMGEVVLPDADTWDAFDKAYRENARIAAS